jgi:hypothetical protein
VVLVCALLRAPCLLASRVLFADIEDLMRVEQILEAEDVLDDLAMRPDARENGAKEKDV